MLYFQTSGKYIEYHAERIGHFLEGAGVGEWGFHQAEHPLIATSRPQRRRIFYHGFLLVLSGFLVWLGWWCTNGVGDVLVASWVVRLSVLNVYRFSVH